MRLSCLPAVLALLALGGSVTSASAALTTLSATDSGFYHVGGSFTSTNGNYAAGFFPGGPPGELRDFFAFDLSAITGNVTSAKLHVTMPSSGYLSVDPTETFSLFDVNTALATLTAHVGSVAIFTDLGSGTSYGSAVLTGSMNGTDIDINLNAAGLAFLNATHAPLAFGGAITTLNPANTTNAEAAFNSSSSAGTRQLILDVTPVPEPASAFLLGLGILGLARRRRPAH